jgi:hypothetical protein
MVQASSRPSVVPIPTLVLRGCCGLALLLAVRPLWAQDARPAATEWQAALREDLGTLSSALADLRRRGSRHVADAAIFAKGIRWALQYDREMTAADRTLLDRSLARGTERSKALADGNAGWLTRRGKVALGYVSCVDGSVQPYGLVIPKQYDPAKPARLDVVLHGSTRPVGLSELRFLSRFDEGDADNPSPPEQEYFELHPLGRVENCYRWSGETDVFEAIEDVSRRYNIDRRRIVLRGMSMGASGTWHLGLKHADVFVALGPYCGYVDTHRFSETPLPTFVKVGPLPEHQELGLHMLDSVDYAANARMVPSIACMGEKDVFFQAHVIMGEAMRREGLEMVNLISPGTGHVIDPVTHAEQMRRLKNYADAGLDDHPAAVHFVTWTLKYSQCHWVQLLALEQHYARAEISGRLVDGRLELSEPKNVTRFALRPDRLPAVPKSVRIGTAELGWPSSADTQALVFVRAPEGWKFEGEVGSLPLTGKRPGVQGPIDDAFTSPFVCVRGTGKPWNSKVHAYALASLDRFAREWHQFFRGDLPVKDDVDVTEEDIQSRNLILFGDPGSNSVMSRILPSLPLQWTSDSLTLGNTKYGSADHLPALITASPFPNARDRYIVLNSGHTFRESELAKLNYLLFPRWGDWAVLKVDDVSNPLTESVVQAGYFDEQWKWKAPAGGK